VGIGAEPESPESLLGGFAVRAPLQPTSEANETPIAAARRVGVPRDVTPSKPGSLATTEVMFDSYVD
jgi:hypothetical protein